MLIFDTFGELKIGSWDFTDIRIKNGSGVGNDSILFQKKSIKPWLKFTAAQANSSVSLNLQAGNTNSSTLEISYSGDDGTWEDYTFGQIMQLQNVGDYVYMRAKSTNRSLLGTRFAMLGLIKASGNIMSLLDKTCTTITLANSDDGCFTSLFAYCTSLLTAPRLPATQLVFGCYQDMFRGCTSLTVAPELPATNLANYCYNAMFQGCSSLTVAPELSATNLANYCYNAMFQGCSSLIEAPELPARILSSSCYQYMFMGCSSLIEAPELPARILSSSCYQCMFMGCSSLIEAPELPARILSSSCYYYMFMGCSSLNTVKLGYAGASSPYLDANWTSDAASRGILYYDGYSNMSGTIPSGWVIKPIWGGLRFIAEQNNSTISMVSTGTPAPSISLETSIDSGKTWQKFIPGTTTITLPYTGTKVYFRAGKGGNAALASSTSIYWSFVITGKVGAIGNTYSLLDGENFDKITASPNYAFVHLFKNCANLTRAPELPATQVGVSCYYMMFIGCSSLTSAPELPATTLGLYCYMYMFYGCSSLTEVPYLPATTLAGYCYVQMFYNCSSLTSIKIGFTGEFNNGKNSFTYWVRGVSASGTLYYNGSDTHVGVSAIPSGWTVQTF